MLRWLETSNGLNWKSKYLTLSIDANDSKSKLEEFLVEFAVNYIKEMVAELSTAKALLDYLQDNWEIKFRKEFKLAFPSNNCKPVKDADRVTTTRRCYAIKNIVS